MISGTEDGVRPPGYRLMLREMAPDERPREKLKLRGSSALSDGDLLAIIMNTGMVGETVTDMSQRLLAQHGGLRGLFQMDVAELARIRGLGDAKAVRLKAALELGRRLAALSPDARPQVGSPEDIANLLQIEMAALEQEQLRVVLLDTKHRIIGMRTVYQGSVNQAQVRVADRCRTKRGGTSCRLTTRPVAACGVIYTASADRCTARAVRGPWPC